MLHHVCLCLICVHVLRLCVCASSVCVCFISVCDSSVCLGAMRINTKREWTQGCKHHWSRSSTGRYHLAQDMLSVEISKALFEGSVQCRTRLLGAIGLVLNVLEATSTTAPNNYCWSFKQQMTYSSTCNLSLSEASSCWWQTHLTLDLSYHIVLATISQEQT